MRNKDQAKMPGAGKKRLRRIAPEDIARLVDKAIRNFEELLDGASGKQSVGDLVRLVQLRKELTADEPGDITVRWVDECEQTDE